VIQNKLFKNVIKFLLLVLILAFVFSGLGGIFSKKELPYALKIADVEYSFFYVDKIFQEGIKESRLKYGKDLSQNDINRLKSDILQNIIDSTLILLEAKKLGIVANDNMVKKEILKIPIFFKNNRFDKDIFDQTIKSYGVSEQGFIDKLKEDIIRITFIDSVSTNKAIIPGLTKVVLQDILQTRDVELIKIPFSAFKIPNKPDNSQLKLIYEKNKTRFRVPEKRNVDYVLISSEFFKEKSGEIDEEKLRKIYNEKSFLFIDSEKRDIKQIQFSSLNNAKRARAEIVKGEEFEKVAKQYAPHFNNYNLGTITAEDFDNDISGKLFKLKVGEISEIIETPLGLYIFKIEKIIPEKKKSFDEVKDLLKKEYLKDVQFKNFLTTIKNIQNELKQGKNLESIAKDYNQKLNAAEITHFINENGDITKSKLFVENTFNTKLNRQSEIFPIDANKFCILRVNEIIPEKNQDFNDLKSQLEQIWHDNELTSFTNKMKISDNNGANSEINKKLFDFSKAKITKISLASNKLNNDIPLDFYKVIFDLKINFYTKPFIDYSHNEVLLAKLKNVNLPSREDIEKNKLSYDSQINQIEQDLILKDILKKLKDKFKVVINNKIFIEK
jgi:peptidyl-prolyl cis-trans isomerase D